MALRPLILLVDDDARAARRLARMLTEDGFEVEQTMNGAGAIARLLRSPLPDAVVTDHYMAYADGLAVAEFARSQRPAMPTVVLTGHAELMVDAARTMNPPAIVLTKPLDYDVLLQMLRGMLPAVA